MKLLSRSFLDSIGVKIDDANYELLSSHFEQVLEKRVIDEIVSELTPEEAEQLATLEQESDQTVLDWLISNVPTFPAIIADEIDILLGEIATNADSII